MGDILEPGTIIKPALTVEMAEDLLSKLYGLKAVSVKELNSYDDRNFLFKVDNKHDNPHIGLISEDGYILKVTNFVDSKDSDFTDAQNSMILHMAGKGMDVPAPVPNLTNKLRSIEDLETAGGVVAGHMVRLLKFIPGKTLYQVDPWTHQHFFQCGSLAARMDNALKDFSHPAYLTRNSIWFLSSIPEVRNFASAVKDPIKNKMIHDIIDSFAKHVIPVQGDLETQIIHGDFNEQNILMRRPTPSSPYSVYSLIDFGDSQLNPLLYELAITIMYMMTKCEDPIMAGSHVLAGYLQQRDLPVEERRLLRTCVAGRYAQSLAMGAYSAQQDPGNEYLLITAKTGWETLTEFWNISQDELYSRWDGVLETYDVKFKNYLSSSI